MGHDIFLSYASEDQSAADAVCEVLERNGIRVWLAPRDILPGADWPASIIDAINGAKVMVFIFSGCSNVSPQVKREVERAVSKGISVLPFRIENVVPSPALEYLISAPHWLDAFSPRWQDHLTRLSEAVKGLLKTEYSEAAPLQAKPQSELQADERRRRKKLEKARRKLPGRAEATLGESSVEAGTQLEKEEKIQVAEDLHLEGVSAGDIAGIKGGSPAGRQPLEVAKRAVIRKSRIGDIVGIKTDSP